MGTNRRYEKHYDAIMNAKILESIARDARPDTLTEAELDREHQDLTKPPVPRPCAAWVRYIVATPAAGQTSQLASFLVDAELCAWTPRAAAIRWRVSAERVDRAWVWASAVEPR